MSFEQAKVRVEELTNILNDCIEKYYMGNESDVSDYDYEDERHWLPGEGKVDWHKLYSKLVGYGYKGTWLYEIGIKTRPNIIKRTRDLTFEDFTRNANEIFSGSPLTLI